MPQQRRNQWPGLREDAAQRPEKAPDPAEHPTAVSEPIIATQAPGLRKAGPGGVSRLRLSRAAWVS